MKQILLTCLLTVLTLTLSAQTQQDMTNYISNPSFENGTDGWTLSGVKRQDNTAFTKKSGKYYIEKWDLILKREYGEYMKLPDLDKVNLHVGQIEIYE